MSATGLSASTSRKPLDFYKSGLILGRYCVFDGFLFNKKFAVPKVARKLRVLWNFLNAIWRIF